MFGNIVYVYIYIYIYIYIILFILVAAWENVGPNQSQTN